MVSLLTHREGFVSDEVGDDAKTPRQASSDHSGCGSDFDPTLTFLEKKDSPPPILNDDEVGKIMMQLFLSVRISSNMDAS
jgi:hypothetical protein